MKKIGTAFVVMILLVSCAVLTPFTKTSISQGEEKTAGIGDIFFEDSKGQVLKDPILGETITGDSFKYELTVVELNNEKIGFQYNEYFYQPGRPGQSIGYTYIPGTPGGWMVKQGFNKRFDYAIADKIIRFKDYEFEIILVENGQVKYKRIK